MWTIDYWLDDNVNTNCAHSIPKVLIPCRIGVMNALTEISNFLLYSLYLYNAVASFGDKWLHLSLSLYICSLCAFQSHNFVALFNPGMSVHAPFIRSSPQINDDVIKWKHFPRYWPFVGGSHRSPVNSPHKGQWRGALMFSLICTRINGWVNTGEAGDLRRHRAHYDVIVIQWAHNYCLLTCLYHTIH